MSDRPHAASPASSRSTGGPPAWDAAPPDPDQDAVEVAGEASWPGLAAAYDVWPGAEATRARFIPPPEKRLDPKAKRLWIINNLIGIAVLVAIAVGISYGLHRWRDLAMPWTVGVPVAIAVAGGLLAWADAAVRYRIWRYEIRTDEVDLMHGLITRRRQLVPMARIQHVDTRQGPLERHYGLATVLFYTAAGGMEIPALSVEHAAEVRNQIAALAKVHDDL
ncbi:MAG: PH domain-containing protein [Thermomicrobiales bacterium]